MTQESLLNPALELYDMLDPWRITPAGKTVLQARGGSDEYWPVHSRANQLLDEIARYLSERAIVSNRPVAGRTNMEALRTERRSKQVSQSSYGRSRLDMTHCSAPHLAW